jgi:hypothetical protein
VVMPRPGGRLVCPLGSWLARGEDGMFSVMADDDFRRRYEPEGD